MNALMRLPKKRSLHPSAWAVGALLLAVHASTMAQDNVAPNRPSAAATVAMQANDEQTSWAEQLQSFAGSFAADPEISTEWATQVLSRARHNARVKRLMTPSGDTGSTVRDWQAYRARLLTPARIESGVSFWRRHRNTLEAVEAQWGVPASVIIGIIGIETSYGQNTGNIRVLDALATLAFDYPTAHPRAAQRQQYFRKELEQFLRLCLSNGMDPLTVTGSFAGAMGIPQFMPSSWLLYSEDFDKSGTSDLINSPQDAIASVANYLQAHGWKAGQPTYMAVDLSHASADDMQHLLEPDILPTFDQNALRQMNTQLLPTGQNYSGQMALVELKNGENPPEYVIGTENFYAVTRYNQSSYYAMAVLQLGEAVQQRLLATTAKQASTQ